MSFLLLAKWEAHGLKEGSSFFVRASGGADDDIHTADSVEGVVGDFWEDQLLFQTHGVVAAAVERLGRDALKVSDSRENHGDQSVKEVVHAVAAKGDFATDLEAFSNFKVRNGFLCDGGDWLLAGDECHVSHGVLKVLRILIRCAGSHVDHDLFQSWNLHDRLVLELLAHLRHDFVFVLSSDSWLREGSRNQS